MINSSNIPGRLAADAQSVDTLRLQAKKDPDQALKGAARQFEALFMNMLLKSMREATPKDGMFDSEQTRLYTSMLDQQLAQSLSAKGVGLADIMIRQLSHSAVPDAQRPSTTAAPTANGTPASQPGVLMPDGPHSSAPAAAPAMNTGLASPNPGAVAPHSASDFVNGVWAYARQASEATGIPARFVVAQAALESGWGKQEIRRADGSQSFNLFGIKAGGNWTGPAVEKTTTEYVNGVAQKTVEKFRAYSSYAEGFRDYANLLRNNPRYAAVLDQRDAAGFAHGLQRAGYATDPAYADKLTRIVNGNVLRQSLTLKA